MNYGKRSTSKKQKSMHSKSAKAGKKASVIFIKAFLVCLLAAGVIGLCAAGEGIVVCAVPCCLRLLQCRV